MTPLGWQTQAMAFGAATVVVLACRGWGSLLRASPAQGKLTTDLALGVILAHTALTAAGLLGTIGVGAGIPIWVLTAVGVALNFRVGTVRLPGWPWVVGVLLLYGIRASIPQGHGDPLYYHLQAPREWYEAGRIEFNPQNPWLLAASVWESLHLWVMHLIGPRRLEDWIAVQIASQWLHVVLGLGGSLMAGLSLGRRWIAKPHWSHDFLWVAALTGLHVVQFTAFLAKNDLGTVFLWLAGLNLLFETRDLRHRFLAALCIGAAVTAKMSTLPLALAVLPWVLWRASAREIWASALGAGLGLAPTVLRNSLLAGAPLYPLPYELGGLALFGPKVQETLSSVRGYWIDGAGIKSRLIEFMLRAPILFGLPWACYVALRQRDSKARAWLAWGGLALAIAMLKTPPYLELRHSAPTAAVCALAVAFSLSSLRRWVRAGLAILLCQFPFFVLAHLPRYSVGVDYLETTHTGGRVKAYLRTLPPTTLGSTWDNEVYYLPHRVRIVSHDPGLGRLDAKGGLCLLKREGASLVLDSRNDALSPSWSVYLRAQPEVRRAYEASDGVVFDISRLKCE